MVARWGPKPPRHHPQEGAARNGLPPGKSHEATYENTIAKKISACKKPTVWRFARRCAALECPAP